MLQPRGELDLSKEALGPERHCQFGVQDLERDRPVVLQVLGEEHRGHAAAPELALKRIAVGERGLQRVEKFAQEVQQVETYKDTVGGPLSEAALQPY
jgi:hypothetical protein